MKILAEVSETPEALIKDGTIKYFERNQILAAMQKLQEKMHSNMQYYMEYCQTNGYVTPMEWIEKYKHF